MNRLLSIIHMTNPQVELRAEAEVDWIEDTAGRDADSEIRDTMSYSL